METVIISLGGSLVVPEEIDVKYVIKFKNLIKQIIKENPNKNFIIVVGGGKTARKYVDSVKNLDLPNSELDWIGIKASRLNAELVRAVFADLAHDVVIFDPTIKIEFKCPVLIGAAYKPGWSTDNVAMLFAETYKVKKVINLSNIDYVYNKNPKEFDDAIKFENMTWEEFIKIVGDKWSPSLNVPFDPIAAKKANVLNAKVAIMNGKNLENVKECILDKSFKGTMISNL